MISPGFADPTAAVFRNMRTLRKARGWSAQELSERLADAGQLISRSSIANAENGRQETTTIGLLFALAHVFDVEVRVLTETSTPPCTQCLGAPPLGYACLACGRDRKDSE